MTVARVVALALTLAAGGCSSVGNGRLVQLDAVEAHARLVPGTTTQADVRRAFGDADVVRFESGLQTWHYSYREGFAKGWDDVPYIGLITVRLDRPTKELVILFDAAGVLRRWSLQTYRHRAHPAEPEASAARSPAS